MITKPPDGEEVDQGEYDEFNDLASTTRSRAQAENVTA
jgi:hypothetical protein